MEEKIERIRKWIGAGSINIFGMQFSGKDTVGRTLAEKIDGHFLSSGDIIRENGVGELEKVHSEGNLTPTDLFREWVLPYFGKEELKGAPLVLSSVGRWSGEEDDVMRALIKAGHRTQAVVLLQIPENEIWKRWEASQTDERRRGRVDDMDRAKVTRRLDEYHDKTVPVIAHYQRMGLVIPVKATGSREEVFENVVNGLDNYISSH